MRIFLSMFAIVTFFFATPQTALAQSKCQTTLECAQLALDAAQASKEMIARLGLKGAVVSFNRASCPRGWEEYAPAYGRFVRGIDTSGSKATDPDGKRAAGNLQADAFKKHDHWGARRSETTTSDTGASGRHKVSVNTTTGVTGKIDETRPKNVALLYCVKK